MRRTTILGALAFLILGVAATSARAITNGQPDGTRHPAVGALVGYYEPAGGTVPYCSGTLISPTVFLTSAHCGFLATPTVQVTFGEAYTASSIVYTGTFHAHPEFTPGTNAQGTQLFDIAVVVFPEPIPGITPARLPTASLLDQMRAAGTLDQSSLFTSVGYGSTEFVNKPGGQTTTYPHTRNYAIGPFNSLTSSFLHLSQHTKKGEGGTCYGDSGGPIFLGAGANETDIIAGIITTGDTYCRSTNVGYRIDTEAARDFLDDYVTLP
jgi:secreted trypsin-like serine protease